MKKIFMALAAAMMMSGTVLAQDAQKPEGQPKPMDKDTVAKERTELMVKEYGLSAEQAQQLLVLNTEYADKLPPMMGPGQRGPRGGQRPQAGDRPQRQRPQKADTLQRQRPPMEGRQQVNREEMRKNMEAYDASLEKILTPEQMKKYKEDRQKRMKNGPRGPHGGGEGAPGKQRN